MSDRQPDGAVSLAIYAEEFRKEGFPAASGGLAFALLLKAERAEGAVTAILGEWHPSSDNFKEYKRLRGDGLTESEAAGRTFTGREAARHGYSEVRLMEETDLVVRIRFNRGLDGDDEARKPMD